MGKIPTLIFLTVCLFALFGCVATSSHVDRGDDLNAQFGRSVLDFCLAEPGSPQANKAIGNMEAAVVGLGKHAEASPSPALPSPPSGDYSWLGGLGPIGVALGSGLTWWANRKKSLRVSEVVADLIDEPDPEKCRARAKGVV